MKILVAGDFCPIHRVAHYFKEADYAFVLEEVREKIERSDYAIVNFECPVCKGGERPIVKRGPHLKCDWHGVEAVKWAGFDCATLANNHFLDYGETGAAFTIEMLRKYGIDMVGGGMNLNEAKHIHLKEVGDHSIAIINCCEHEFSLATNMSAGSNPLNPINQYYDILEAKKIADYVIVIVHGGHEMFNLPSLRMQDIYRFFIDVGADAVINNHQHCYSGYEVYKGKPIFYGLGNLCFDMTDMNGDLWNTGMMVSLSFDVDTIHFTLYPYTQCKEEAKIEFMDGERMNQFNNHIIELNRIICDREKLTEAVYNYYASGLRRSKTAFEPIQNRYFNGLQARGYLPSFISNKRIKKLYNVWFCESHREKVDFFLEQWSRK